MKDYKIVNISSKTLSLFKRCFDKNGSPKEEEKVKWQFLESPINERYVDIALDKKNNQVAAIYAIFPIAFILDSKIVTASQSLDTMTDKDYRGKGLFVNLAKDVYDKASQNNIQFVYGFPNGNSIHGFIRKLNWINLDPVPFLIKPLKTKYFTKRISFLSWLPNINLSKVKNKLVIKDISIIENNLFPNEVNKIWYEFSKSFKVALNRDKEYLDWRYLKKPLENYRIIHAYTKENEYLGFVVFAIKEKHGGKIGYVMELIYNPSSKKVGEVLLSYAVNEMKKSQCDCVLSWCFDHSPNYNAFKKSKFYKIPEKLKPIELHFGVRFFNSETSEIINNRENWYLSYSDSDTV
ncbi:GNAT family N-acetyltransferase [Tenacibaculum sp. 47A_GOM-205m]|uniref:GNAT family N-acetyltransferase n=1 Tax=Tenacibaculum sp. 47A_GOM-205m TaxID=1380384 RepID=UPI00049168FF|nr:GNAT family N-acetyltransferase [Tenacibaculum sp. 47A_GOM-205m]